MFVLPAMMNTLIGPILSMVDTAFVGQGSITELAALGPAVLIADVTSYVFSWLGIATVSFMAKAISEGKDDEVDRLTRAAMLLGVVCGLGVFVWHTLGATALLTGLNTGPELMDPARTYVLIRALGFPVQLLNTAMWGVCLGHKDPSTPLTVSLVSVVLNLIGDYTLCTLMGMGIAGAAWATVAAQYFSALVYPVSMKLRRKTYLSRLRGPLALADVTRYWGFAVPVMFVTAATLSVYAVMTAVANMQGVVVAAAHKVAGGLFQFFAMCGEPMFQGAQALLPRDSEESVKVFVAALSVVGVVVGVAAGLIAVATTLFAGRLFTSDPGVLAEAAKVSAPLFLSLMLIIPSRTFQGLVVAQSDLGFYAGITAVDAVLFAAAVYYSSTVLGAGYVGMWWVHVGLWVVNVSQFALRVGLKKHKLS